MPDRVSRPPSFEDALLMVEDRIRRRLGGFDRLDRRALGKYAARQPAAGWRLTIPTPEGDRRLDVVVPKQFPFALPRVAFVGPSMFLKWAHFERDGVLCLDGEGFDVDRPGEVVADRIASACRLIGECERGERDGDFVDEFLSYWGQAANDEGVPIYSLLPPNGPSRLVRVWRGKRFVLVADSDEAIAAWLKNRFGSVDIKTQSGALIWLDRPPLPAAFPNSGAAVRRLAAEAGFTDEQLCELVMQDASGATLLLGIDTPAGPALASTWVAHPTRRGRSILRDGFRKKWCRRRSPWVAISAAVRSSARASIGPMRPGFTDEERTRDSIASVARRSRSSGAARSAPPSPSYSPSRVSAVSCSSIRNGSPGRTSAGTRWALPSSERTSASGLPARSGATSLTSPP
ncbi:hypothetical protein I6F35_35810 [Bradyrhizobium sp. BRP22]|nr:hypothetical protein [Bradyrhizobium sp. BRP22]